MIRILCITKENCFPCKVAIANILEAANNINCDLSIDIRNATNELIEKYSIIVCPTTIISENNIIGSIDTYKELVRLEGSFPTEYLNNILDDCINNKNK